jgi:2-polyprenyl-6-methoxyphenol hydroxylase-like FAD-dependent oxidoreductase
VVADAPAPPTKLGAQRFPVLIVGAGPVGLTLAIDLAQRGIRCLVVEKRPQHGKLPKMERVNPRTMEQFHRLGFVQRVRDAGYPEDMPMDVFVAESLVAPPIVHHPQASVRALKELGGTVNDGTMPLEPYQVISQYTLEPLLRSVAEELAPLTLRFGCELLSFSQDADGVQAVLRDAAGAIETVSTQYLVGCDGGTSTVRKALDIGLSGDPHLLDICQGLFRSDTLFEQLPRKGRHFHILDEHNTFLIVQDDCRHFTLHSVVDDPAEMDERFEAAVGMPVEYETLFAGQWTMRAMLADAYGRGRVFIAGDAAHLMPPTAGLGMNTGVGDAIDLAWKLEAVLQGWGGDRLLDSYELERRPVAAANVSYSVTRFDARQTWRATVPEAIASGTLGSPTLARLISENEARQRSMEGLELGYSYAGSPLIPGGAELPYPHADSNGIERPYRPSVGPGVRLPHLWLAPGMTPVQEVVPRDAFALLCFTEPGAVGAAFEAAFGAEAVPLVVLELDCPEAGTVYGVPYVLVRPDLHVVWAGEEEPDDPGQLARLSVGMP